MQENEVSVFPTAVFAPHLHHLPAAKNISGVYSILKNLIRQVKLIAGATKFDLTQDGKNVAPKLYSLNMSVIQEVQRFLTSQKFDIQMQKPKTEEVYNQHCV